MQMRKLDWKTSDDEQRFLDNLKNKRALLKRHGWLREDDSPVPVEYVLNENGFRDDPIVHSPDSAIAIGCSVTFGIGIQREYTWPSLLQESLGKKVWNLGVPGGSLDSCFRVLCDWLPITESKEVFWQTPSMFRREYYSENSPLTDYIQLGHWSENDPVFKLLLNDTEFKLNKKRQTYAILQLCQRYDAKIYFFDGIYPPPELRDLESKPFARDLLHPGKNWHDAVKNLFMDKYDLDTDYEEIYSFMEKGE